MLSANENSDRHFVLVNVYLKNMKVVVYLWNCLYYYRMFYLLLLVVIIDSSLYNKRKKRKVIY